MKDWTEVLTSPFLVNVRLAVMQIGVDDVVKTILYHLFNQPYTSTYRLCTWEMVKKPQWQGARLIFTTSDSTKEEFNKYTISKLKPKTWAEEISIREFGGVRVKREITCSSLIMHKDTVDLHKLGGHPSLLLETPYEYSVTIFDEESYIGPGYNNFVIFIKEKLIKLLS